MEPATVISRICKCCCGYIEHTWAQWAPVTCFGLASAILCHAKNEAPEEEAGAGLPIRCLYHEPVRALDEPKVVFEDPEE